MTASANAKVSGRGQTSLPAELRRRWGIADGGEVGVNDLGSGLPDARVTVPAMAKLARRHPVLNVMNLEAVAAAQAIGATVWLSDAAAAGVLPGVLDDEGLRWTAITIR